jgi:hypothetical protein
VLHCRIAQMGLDPRLGTASLDLKPPLKLGTRRKLPSDEQLACGLGHFQSIRGGPGKRMDVDQRLSIEQCERITAKQVIPAHAPTRFAQAPSQSPQRVDRVLEEQLDQLAACEGPIAQG